MINLLQRKQNQVITDPPIVTRLLTDARFALIWLPIRVWLGLQWLQSAQGKLENAGWTQTGEALKGYWERAVAIPAEGRPAITFGWYRDFLEGMLNAEAYTWFAKLIAFGELFIGIALIIGAFVGIAAFFGAFMNWNFMMAGSASSNPMLFVAALGLILAWKIAGFIGADYVLLNWLGTPWNRSKAASAEQEIYVPQVGYAPSGD